MRLDQLWFSYLLQSPFYLGLLVAGVMCSVRARENRRGAVLLGIAILLQLAAHIPYLLLRIFPNLLNQIAMIGVEPQYLFWGIMAVTALIQGAAWVLIALAVFTRPRYEKFVPSPDFP